VDGMSVVSGSFEILKIDGRYATDDFSGKAVCSALIPGPLNDFVLHYHWLKEL